MAEIELQAATIVTVAKDEPYPTGTPPDGLLIPARVHKPQELTDGGAPWTTQSVKNLAAGGLYAGGAVPP